MSFRPLTNGIRLNRHQKLLEGRELVACGTGPVDRRDPLQRWSERPTGESWSAGLIALLSIEPLMTPGPDLVELVRAAWRL